MASSYELLACCRLLLRFAALCRWWLAWNRSCPSSGSCCWPSSSFQVNESKCFWSSACSWRLRPWLLGRMPLKLTTSSVRLSELSASACLRCLARATPGPPSTRRKASQARIQKREQLRSCAAVLCHDSRSRVHVPKAMQGTPAPCVFSFLAFLTW